MIVPGPLHNAIKLIPLSVPTNTEIWFWRCRLAILVGGA